MIINIYIFLGWRMYITLTHSKLQRGVKELNWLGLCLFCWFHSSIHFISFSFHNKYVRNRDQNRTISPSSKIIIRNTSRHSTLSLSLSFSLSLSISLSLFQYPSLSFSISLSLFKYPSPSFSFSLSIFISLFLHFSFHLSLSLLASLQQHQKQRATPAGLRLTSFTYILSFTSSYRYYSRLYNKCPIALASHLPAEHRRCPCIGQRHIRHLSRTSVHMAEQQEVTYECAGVYIFRHIVAFIKTDDLWWCFR